jgi:hypothetical protein
VVLLEADIDVIGLASVAYYCFYQPLCDERFLLRYSCMMIEYDFEILMSEVWICFMVHEQIVI